jgi:signal recognition particle GTPase
VSQNEATYKSSDKNEEENKEEKLDEGKFDSNDYYNL